MKENDTWTLDGHTFSSRFILGSGKFSLPLIEAAIKGAGAEMVTLALRRVNTGGKANIMDYISKSVTVLPNTSGARNADEAVRIARLSREICHTPFIKIEIMKDSRYLLPDNAETIKATETLAKEGFVVMPYMFPDLTAARAMKDAGASCIMPLAAPIGSNKGLVNKEWINILLEDGGLPICAHVAGGKLVDACAAEEMGVTAIMANTAIATSGNLVQMAEAFRLAIEAGRTAYLAGLGRVLQKGADPSSPLTGFLRDED